MVPTMRAAIRSWRITGRPSSGAHWNSGWSSHGTATVNGKIADSVVRNCLYGLAGRLAGGGVNQNSKPVLMSTSSSVCKNGRTF